MELRPLRAVKCPGLERVKKRLGTKCFCLDHDPAAKGVGPVEMRVIRGHQRQVATLGQQQIGAGHAFTTIAAHRAGVVVDFHRMCRVDGARIGLAQP